MAFIDDLTNLPYQVKRPAPEVRDYSVDFKLLIPTTGTITSVTSVTVVTTSTNSLIVSNITFSGTLARFTLSNGDDGVNYRINIAVSDSFGNTLEDSILIKVRDAGNIRN